MSQTMESSDSERFAKEFVNSLGKRLSEAKTQLIAPGVVLQKAIDRIPDTKIKNAISNNFVYYENLLNKVINRSSFDNASLKLGRIGLGSGPSSVSHVMRKNYERLSEISPDALQNYLKFAHTALPHEICRCLFKLTAMAPDHMKNISHVLGVRVATNSSWANEHPKSVACITAFIVTVRFIQCEEKQTLDWSNPLITSISCITAPLLFVSYVAFWLNKLQNSTILLPSDCQPLMMYTIRSLNIAARSGDMSRGEPEDAICSLFVLQWLQTFPDSREKREFQKLLSSLLGPCTIGDIRDYIGEVTGDLVAIEKADATKSLDLNLFLSNPEMVAESWNCLENTVCRRRIIVSSIVESEAPEEGIDVEDDDDHWTSILKRGDGHSGRKKSGSDDLLAGEEYVDEEEDEGVGVGFMMDTKGDSSILAQLGDIGADEDVELEVEEPKEKKKMNGKKRGVANPPVDIEQQPTRPQRKNRRQKR